MLLKCPDDFEDLDDERKAEIKYQIFKLTLFQLYFIKTEEKNPILAKTLHIDHGKTRCLPLEYAGNICDGDIVSRWFLRR